MAGIYPDVPDYKLAYDRDGTEVVVVDSGTGVITAQTEAIRQNLQTSTGVLRLGEGPTYYVVFLFPKAMDITGILLSADFSDEMSYNGAQWSNDTTTGNDGTWTAFTITPDSRDATSVSKAITREQIDTVSLTAVTAIRFICDTAPSGGPDNDIICVNFYGSPTAVDDRLEIWHPTLDQRLAPAVLDWGDDMQGHTETAQFRVKNLSGTETASAIELSIDALEDIEFGAAHQLSLDDVTYTNTISIGDVAPGATSVVAYLKKTYAVDQQVGLGWARIVSNVTGGWV